MKRFQVMCTMGSTYPDTSATDEASSVGPQHESREAAEAWMESEHLRTTSNREYYEKYWIEEVAAAP
ncbi:MAG: hypothetical protein O3A02_03175 [bacterium]|nr:hypothetical protein [bacterium]